MQPYSGSLEPEDCAVCGWDAIPGWHEGRIVWLCRAHYEQARAPQVLTWNQRHPYTGRLRLTRSISPRAIVLASFCEANFGSMPHSAARRIAVVAPRLTA